MLKKLIFLSLLSVLFVQKSEAAYGPTDVINNSKNRIHYLLSANDPVMAKEVVFLQETLNPGSVGQDMTATINAISKAWPKHITLQ